MPLSILNVNPGDILGKKGHFGPQMYPKYAHTIEVRGIDRQ